MCACAKRRATRESDRERENACRSIREKERRRSVLTRARALGAQAAVGEESETERAQHSRGI